MGSIIPTNSRQRPLPDFDAASELASRADVVTCEFENVDTATIDQDHIARSTEALNDKRSHDTTGSQRRSYNAR